LPASLLISPDDVYARTGQVEHSDVTDVLTQSIAAATVYIESVLRTSLSFEIHTDRFYLPSYEFTAKQFLKLALSNGLVSSSPVITVKKERTLLGLNDSALVMTVDPALYTVQLEAGVLVVYTSKSGIPTSGVGSDVGVIPNDYLSVTYTSGIPESTAGIFDATMIPPWMAELAYQYVTFLMNDTPTLVKEGSEQKTPDMFDRAAAGHLRLFPDAIKPLF